MCIIARMGPTRVLVVEDDDVMRSEIVRRVGATPGLCVVAEAVDLAGARRGLDEPGVELALFDLHLPDGNAISLIPEARARRIAVLVLTMFEDNASVFDAIAAGAGGYVLKDDALATVGEALLTLLQGGAPISPRIASRLLERFRCGTSQPEGTSPLTGRERSVIELFASGATYAEVGSALDITVNTVRQHVRHIYEKLHISTKAEAVAWYSGRLVPGSR